MSAEELSQDYAVKVGERLRSVRKQKKLSLQAVEESSGMEFKSSVLGAYERGERSISVPRLQRLAAIYGVPSDQLLPKDSVPEVFQAADFVPELPSRGSARVDTITVDSPSNSGEGTKGIGPKVTIDLTRLGEVSGPEKELLKRYLSMIQVQRQDFNGRMITIRGEDLKVVGALMDMTAEEIAYRLDELGLRVLV
ncbi:MAG: transcriptional regulator [Acidimicrobiaceae bacterium]|nr:transcriptional regulator [Acidimicrobiaceae bacterium]